MIIGRIIGGVYYGVDRLPPPPPRLAAVHVMPDIAPFTTQDGTHITSRSKLRAYERTHGVKQVGNDLPRPA